MFLSDDETQSIIMIGETRKVLPKKKLPSSIDEARKGRSKPMVGFIAGRTSPPGRTMGHAGAVISGGKGGADDRPLHWKKLRLPLHRPNWGTLVGLLNG